MSGGVQVLGINMAVVVDQQVYFVPFSRTAAGRDTGDHGGVRSGKCTYTRMGTRMVRGTERVVGRG